MTNNSLSKQVWRVERLPGLRYWRDEDDLPHLRISAWWLVLFGVEFAIGVLWWIDEVLG